jgi:hypothetical protein
MTAPMIMMIRPQYLIDPISTANNCKFKESNSRGIKTAKSPYAMGKTASVQIIFLKVSITAIF